MSGRSEEAGGATKITKGNTKEDTKKRGVRIPKSEIRNNEEVGKEKRRKPSTLPFHLPLEWEPRGLWGEEEEKGEGGAGNGVC